MSHPATIDATTQELSPAEREYPRRRMTRPLRQSIDFRLVPPDREVVPEPARYDRRGRVVAGPGRPGELFSAIA